MKIGAGTNARVFLKIYGENENTEKIELKHSLINQNPFERGKTDLFKVQIKDVGKIVKINISHNGKGLYKF
jgi:hypothetical protein